MSCKPPLAKSNFKFANEAAIIILCNDDLINLIQRTREVGATKKPIPLARWRA